MKLSFLSKLARLSLCMLLLPLSASAVSTVEVVVPESHRVSTAELQSKRLVEGNRVLNSIPEQLKGLTTIVPPRGDGGKPGAAYEIEVRRPTAVYISVFPRGRYVPPEPWKNTGLRIGWETSSDEVYAAVFPPGKIQIPEHAGLGGLYGVPHLAVLSEDVAQAQALIANPVVTPKPRVKSRLRAELASPTQPGLYAHPGQEVKWRLRFVGGDAVDDPKTVRVKITEEGGDFQCEQELAIGTGRSTPVLSLRLPRLGFYPMSVLPAEGDFFHPYDGALGAVPEPLPPSKDSPWAVMRATRFMPSEASLARILGVSTVRHPLWLSAELTILEEGDDPKIKVSMAPYLANVKSYVDQGIRVLSGFQMVPTNLSSKPGDMSRGRVLAGDAGPKQNRVIPRDYRIWQAYVSEIVRQSDGLISHWELGNEPNMPDGYWGGTPEEFAK